MLIFACRRSSFVCVCASTMHDYFFYSFIHFIYLYIRICIRFIKWRLSNIFFLLQKMYGKAMQKSWLPKVLQHSQTEKKKYRKSNFSSSRIVCSTCKIQINSINNGQNMESSKAYHSAAHTVWRKAKHQIQTERSQWLT